MNAKCKNKLYAPALLLALLLIWQLLSMSGLIPAFMLPAPLQVIQAMVKDFPLLMSHLYITLLEAALGLGAGVGLGFVFALLMDRFQAFRQAFYPLLVLTQTIPTVAIAPLLVLWMGFGTAPKVLLILTVTFFPIAVHLLDAFQRADKDQLRLLQAMGAGRWQIFRYMKWPAALGSFFASLKISASYAIVGAVIAEWLGGTRGLGVYMTLVRKSYSFDKMFAVIFIISALSLLLIAAIQLIGKACMPWDRAAHRGRREHEN